MPAAGSNPGPCFTETAVPPLSFNYNEELPRGDSSPTAHEVAQLIERRQLEQLGDELPITAAEAADYVGVPLKQLERLASRGEIPARSVGVIQVPEWNFYPSELDCWLKTQHRGGNDAV